MTDTKPTPAPLAAHGADPLSGRFVTPGDNVISLRALLVAALTVGRSSITGLRASHDVLMLAAALRQMGVIVEQRGDVWQVQGLGVAGLLQPQEPLQRGHSLAALPLLLGLLAPYGFVTRFSPGPRLSRAAMAALSDGLGAMGARLDPDPEGGLSLHGACLPLPARRTLSTPAEPIKTALLLAGLQIAGDSVIHEVVATRDHTEKLLAAFGADITVTPDAGGGDGVDIRLVGLPELSPQHISVPGDPSAAGFAIVAALIIKGSDLLIENVLINPLRTGLIDTLLGMGGDIQFLNQREIAGEHAADLRVRSSWLKGTIVDRHQAGAMLEDIVALSIAAAFAQGETIINGLGEMGERLDMLTAGLIANKVGVAKSADSLTIAGDSKVAGGGRIDSQGDAAIAMGFAVLGLASRQTVTIADASAIADSFPGFVAAMTAAGGRFPLIRGVKP
ncbi:MAG: 3-phosphoshikimate 1-carboxyvinyltransferase [Devosia sp.]